MHALGVWCRAAQELRGQVGSLLVGLWNMSCKWRAVNISDDSIAEPESCLIECLLLADKGQKR